MIDPTTEGLRAAFGDAQARAGRPEGTREDVAQVLTFALADEWYGFRLADLVEILGSTEPTPLPFMPPFIPGVINHRGSVVVVIDLKKVFGLHSRYRKDLARVVLVRHGKTVLGIEADAISEIVSISPSQLEPPPATMEKVKAEYIAGCVRRPRGLLAVLSAKAVVEGLQADAAT